MNTNKSLLFIGLSLLFLGACKEQKAPGLDLGGAFTTDSSYVASVEAKQDKVIVIEELTGVTCANCPKAAQVIKDIQKAHPNRVIAVGMHPPSSNFTEPVANKSKYDFRQDAVDEIAILLGGRGALPSASLNREKITSGKIFDKDRGSWISRINPWLSETTPVNIRMESSYSSDSNQVELITKVAFTEEVQEDLYLSVYVTENGIIDYQADGLIYISDYEHNHVFRKILTSVSGSSLNFADKNAGTVLQKRIKFEPTITGDNAWNLDNCTVIAFVHKSGSDQSILHGAEVSLK